MMKNTSESKGLQRVSRESEFVVGTSKRIETVSGIVAVWRLEDGYYAIDDACPHAGASLSFGQLSENGIVSCPRHGAQFEIRTGKVIALPSTRGVRRYPVKIVDGEVFVGSEPMEQKQPELLNLR